MTLKPGIHLGVLRSVPIPDRLRLIHEAGFDATALWWPDVDDDLRPLRDSVPAAARTLGLEIDHLHVPYADCDDLWADDPATRTTAIQRHRQWLNDCAQHAVPTMVMHATLSVRRPLNIDHGSESLRRIVGYAEELGITIAIENTRRPDYIATLLDRIDSPHLGLCYDNAHDDLYADRPGELLTRYQHRLAAAHLSDHDGKRDRHWIPGTGKADLSPIIHALTNEVPTVTPTIEAVTRDTGQAALEFLVQARQSLTTLTNNIDDAATGARTASPR